MDDYWSSMQILLQRVGIIPLSCLFSLPLEHDKLCSLRLHKPNCSYVLVLAMAYIQANYAPDFILGKYRN